MARVRGSSPEARARIAGEAKRALLVDDELIHGAAVSKLLGSRSDNPSGGGNGTFKPSSDVPADTSDFEGATVSSGGGSDDDIPF